MCSLLQPRSIALVGASDKADTLGRAMVDMVRAGGYAGEVYAVNPNYKQIGDIPCYASISDIPGAIEHVVLGLGNDRIESALDSAISRGVRAATIFASCAPYGDGGKLRERIAAKAVDIGMAVCGSNCMGFYNNRIGLRVAGYPALQPMPAGTVGWIAQSGSVFGALAHNDQRLKFAFAVSSGSEMVTTAADYLAWMASHDNIRAIGMFLESIRDPERFSSALELAASKDLPIVVLKVGRSEASAVMALSHTGAIAGSDAAHEALFKRYGVIQVDDEDELAATLLMFQQPRRPGRGGLVAIHDSGGERELAADIACNLGLTYPELDPATKLEIGRIIDPELIPSNPLDAWGGTRDFTTVFSKSFIAMVKDRNAAIGVMFCNIRDGYYVSEGIVDSVIATYRSTEKPVALVTNYSMVNHSRLVARLADEGVPVIDGTRVGLKAVKNVLNWRDRGGTGSVSRPRGCGSGLIAQKWRARLMTGSPLSEFESLSLLSDYGLDTAKSIRIDDMEDLLAACATVTYPVALKTALPGVLHKSDVGGVVLNISNAAMLVSAYERMSSKLGPAALVAEMAPKGVELAFGAVIDQQWGLVICVSAGGILMELLDDRAVALGPLSAEEAKAMVCSLKVDKLLKGYRGEPAVSVETIVEGIVRFSWLAWDFSDLISEIDINPVIANKHRSIAVDALIIQAPLPNKEART